MKATAQQSRRRRGGDGAPVATTPRRAASRRRSRSRSRRRDIVSRGQVTHPNNLPPSKHTRFERYEFLGDRVLGLAVAEWLEDHYPDVLVP